jgi:hypothetical protein
MVNGQLPFIWYWIELRQLIEAFYWMIDMRRQLRDEVKKKVFGNY